MACQIRKKYFWHIWCPIAPQHLVFMKIGVQTHESPFFLLSEIENRIEKSCFCQELWLLKIVHRFSIFAQKCWHQQNNGNLRTNWYIFSEALTVQHLSDFMFLAYPYPEIWTADKKEPSRPTRIPKSPGLIVLTCSSCFNFFQLYYKRSMSSNLEFGRRDS